MSPAKYTDQTQSALNVLSLLYSLKLLVKQ